MSDRIYCYPDSDVLMNKLNIHEMCIRDSVWTIGSRNKSSKTYLAA